MPWDLYHSHMSRATKIQNGKPHTHTQMIWIGNDAVEGVRLVIYVTSTRHAMLLLFGFVHFFDR